MACNCGAKYDNKVPCCCSQGSPLVCTTTTCADAQPCDQTIESNCVIYTGPNIACSGVTTGMTVTQVMDIILEGVNLINCSYCWNVTNTGGSQTEFDYIDADGNTINYPAIAAGATVQVCGRSVVQINGITATKLGRCSACFPVTTTTTATPNLRCTFLSVAGQAGDYRIERDWNNLTNNPATSESYTFVLYDFTVNGIQYANAETLTINLTSDLVTGIGLDGGTYIMNISDWLSTVAPQGFVCHDDMKVIEHPLGYNYSIRVRRINTHSGTLDYYYTSTYGFAYGEEANTYGTYFCIPHSISTTTTIPPSFNIARCTAGAGNGIGLNYFKMERTWQQSSYTFVISSMVLDGVEYANGEALIVQSPADLVTSISPIDGLNYIMNISDFLNTAIPSVTAAGWRFYDDMHVIEKPSPTSTYSILIERTQANGIQANYYYSSQYGFSVDDIDNTYGLYTCEPTVAVYSQVVSFATPMNSIIYNSNGTFVGACYGSNQTNLNSLVSMFNSNPPVASNSCFLAYGTYFNNGDGRVKVQMPLSVYNTLSSNGTTTLTLNVIYD
jgi:hypothetical protein